jgi:choline dehydrogenase-like flavoprotein
MGVVGMLGSESTTFTLDNMGRFLCNTLQEALDGATQGVAGARPDFDVIIIGGGTFGSVMAEALFQRDRTHSRRILVLEQGPFVLAEHAQNTPFQGGAPNFRRPWVNDPALEQDLQYPGLVFAIGGRSLLWGGWSPEPLHDPPNNNDELAAWPASAVGDLQGTYFAQASDAIGVTATNDYIFGPLHEALRQRLLNGLTAAAPGGLILDRLPDHPIVRAYRRQHPAPNSEPPDAQLRDWLNLPASAPQSHDELLRLLRLEAPLAVQASAAPGFFPFNKFSGVPLITEAARTASVEADGTGPAADARKRVTVVPDWHVQELITQTQADNWVRVTGVRVADLSGAQIDIPLASPGADGTQGVVVLALGTIESTRLALTTFQASLAGRAAQRMGENFVAHLRSNLTIRIPTASVPGLAAALQRWAAMPDRADTMEVSALFSKGKATVNGVDHYFHVQITASGTSPLGTNSEALLFRKVPDVEQVQSLLQSSPSTVVITLRGIGEMTTMNPDSRVGLAQTPSDVDFGRPKAYANLGDARAASGGSAQTQADRAAWNALDDFIDQLALIFANGQAFEILSGTRWGLPTPDWVIPVPAGATPADLQALRSIDGGRLQQAKRDPLGTTHHEAGTLRMSDLPADGVTNPYGRVHDTTNCYIAGPALFPATGSPNPMLSSVALIHRTGDLLTASVLPRPAPWAPDAGFRALFDGTAASLSRWSRISAGASNGFALTNGEIVTYGGQDFGLLYYAAEAFADFTLRLEFRITDLGNQNSGVFVRFRDPTQDLPAQVLDRIRGNANAYPGFPADFQLFTSNRAWSAVYSGFEVQIDDNARGDRRRDFYGQPEPDGLRKNRTGAIYKIPAGDQIPGTGQFDAALQQYQPAPDLVPGRWYQMQVDVQGDAYTVTLTDLQTGARTPTTSFQNTDNLRGVATIGNRPAGYVGLQSYPFSPIAFRHIQIRT